MNYRLINCDKNDIDRLIKYKKKTIFDYAHNLSIEEINNINNYVIMAVPKNINDYSNIVIDDKVIGSLLVTKEKDGVLIDEIFIEDEYRNKGLGSNIIKNIINKNKAVYLWVYKENIKAINLYKKLGFIVEEETKTRYYMKVINK